MALFHTVASVTCEIQKEEKKSQIAGTVPMARMAGVRVPTAAIAAITSPSTHVLV